MKLSSLTVVFFFVSLLLAVAAKPVTIYKSFMSDGTKVWVSELTEDDSTSYTNLIYHYELHIEASGNAPSIIWKARTVETPMYIVGPKYKDHGKFAILDVKSIDGRYAILYRDLNWVFFDLISGELQHSCRVCSVHREDKRLAGQIVVLDSPYVIVQNYDRIRAFSAEKEIGLKLASLNKSKDINEWTLKKKRGINERMTQEEIIEFLEKGL